MSYQVLARKYRPQSFSELVGQASTCRILQNALTQQRIHHAYLFTGTRGVGKTSLARLLAKCLNCQTQMSAEPCGHCVACQAIHAGRFADLIEVDAASRTRVEDTRDLLADVHYAPSQGRYKIYLIDEVHMLSTHSFNALLKTLEEPPAHVVFLLATTDPQRLPATILSRCLQFHLKALTNEALSAHLTWVLKKEAIPYEDEAVHQLAIAAQGSVRDALSLLDQAIAYAPQGIHTADIQQLLGCIAKTDVQQLLSALLTEQVESLWSAVEAIHTQAVDYNQVMEALLEQLHQIALIQTLPATLVQVDETTQRLAQHLAAEDTQLYYQIVQMSRRDLALAPSPRLAFEMMVLRLLAFKPNQTVEQSSSITPPRRQTPPSQINVTSHSKVTEKPLTYSKQTQSPPTASVEANKDLATNACLLAWIDLLTVLKLTGLTAALARQCVLQKPIVEQQILLWLDPKQAALQTQNQEQKLRQALSEHFKHPVSLTIQLGPETLLTPARYAAQQKDQRIQQTTQLLENDPTVREIMNTFDTTIRPESIELLDEP